MKPIIFRTDMVQALLNTKPGTFPAEPIDASKPYKSQMRRVVKGYIQQSVWQHYRYDGVYDGGLHYMKQLMPNGDSTGKHLYVGKSAYYPGDILWVRETFGYYTENKNDANYFVYKADFPENAKIYLHNSVICDLPKWKPSIHMPREAARLFLEVKSVRVERVQDITETDAKAEGAENFDLFKLKQIPTTILMPGGAFGKGYMPKASYKAGFYKIWQELDKKRGYSWDSNPWVLVYEFMRVE